MLSLIFLKYYHVSPYPPHVLLYHSSIWTLDAPQYQRIGSNCNGSNI